MVIQNDKIKEGIFNAASGYIFKKLRRLMIVAYERENV